MKSSSGDTLPKLKSPALKLWQTQESLDSAVEAYTVGDDPQRDQALLPYEVYGSLAHATGLADLGLISARELKAVRRVLRGIIERPESFKISRAQEDVHTAVEQLLTQALGETGAKIHAGRSRNDQVQVDLRLFIKDQLLDLQSLCCDAASAWEKFGRRYDRTPMPGYTHLQRAMPTTVGHWAASHTEAFLENIPLLQAALNQADACPLGSAAGFGVGLPLPRERVSKLLGFARVQRNTLRVQSSRTRIEAAAVSALTLLARDIGTLAWDISLFTMAQFGFISLGEAFTTGSSIMPQKRNPDVAELTRARAALFGGWLQQILSMGSLPSGYHRDYQLTKGPLCDAFAAARDMLAMTIRLASALRVNAARCKAAITDDMLATQRAVALVRKGTPFRQAYRQIAACSRSQKTSQETLVPIEFPNYAGTPGQVSWKSIARDRRTCAARILSERNRLHAAWKALLAS